MKNTEHNFFDDVYEVVKLIPSGRVTSYGAIAAYLGAKRSARVVGWAMKAAHDLEIPAHRVVNRNGLLTGKHHFDSPNKMEQKLEAEGIIIQQGRIINFDKFFWDPSVELSI